MLLRVKASYLHTNVPTALVTAAVAAQIKAT